MKGHCWRSGENPRAGCRGNLRDGADTPEGIFDGERGRAAVFAVGDNIKNTKKPGWRAYIQKARKQGLVRPQRARTLSRQVFHIMRRHFFYC